MEITRRKQLFDRAELAPVLDRRRAGNDRIVLANGTDYILYWYDADHQFVSRMGTDGAMPRMPPAERRRREEINLRNQRLATEIPDHTPYLGSEALDFDGQGRLWVRTLRWSGIGDERTATEFDVYSPDGVLVGVVVVAVRFVENWPTVSVRGDVLAGAYVDEDGHHRVGVWRIVG